MFKEGSQGLLDMAINNASMADEERHLRSLKADDFKEVAKIFESELLNKGFNVLIAKDEIDLKNFEKFKGAKSGTFKKDISKLFQENEAQKVIILQLLRYGAIRSYYGFIPLTDPKGVATVQGVMINKSDNSILWRTGLLKGDIKVDVEGEWHQKPDYPALTDAVNEAIKKSKEYLESQFFTNQG